MTKTTTSALSPLATALIDDAALFPPGSAPMADAVRRHFAHRSSWYAPIIGPFLCADQRLPELQRQLDRPLGLGLLVTGGAGALEPALTWAAKDERLVLSGVEIALRDEPDLGRNARRIAYALESADLPEEVPVSVEVPIDRGLEDALDVLAETGLRAKLRTGRPDGSAPAAEEVARFVLASIDREVSFKCTAGLHHAVRQHTSGEHGFLNIVLATRAAIDGASLDQVAAQLAESDAAAVAGAVRDLGDDRVASTRRWFRSYGSCSITEPIDDLRALGLLEEPT